MPRSVAAARTGRACPLPRGPRRGSAGYDLASAEDGELAPGGAAAVRAPASRSPFPPDSRCQIRPRSGLALKHGVTLPNTPATIDSDYRGELKVALVNLGQRAVRGHPGHADCPDGVRPGRAGVASGRWRRCRPTDRGEGGFGSTGH